MKATTVMKATIVSAAVICGAIAIARLRGSRECDTRLVVPAGFCATSFAENVGPARHLVVSANGTV